MTGHDLATLYTRGGTRRLAEPHHVDYRTEQEAEAVLEQLARALVPAHTELQKLASTLSEAPGRLGEGGEEGLTQAEFELRKAEARYRALVEQIPAITFMAPLDGTLSELYVSPQIEAMLGFTAKEWLDNPILWYQQLHPEDQDRWQVDFARTLNAGEHFRSDYRFIARDGSIVWIHGEAKVVSDEEGRPLFLQGVAFDITERMRAEEKLQKNNAQLALARDQALAANRAKSAFLANMSHELRTPLHAILGFTEMLQEDAEDGGHDAFLPDLNKISDAAKHLVGLISNILDLSKIEAGKMQLFLEEFDLTGTIHEVLSTAVPLIEKNGNDMEIRLADDLGTIHADATKVRQVLFNLLSNAAKFTENGCITLEAVRVPAVGGDRFRLRVIDTGVGIEAAHLDKLFQSFTQVDDSTTRKFGGTGLGLAISQRFCQMMGGGIRVYSTPGKGTTFTVDLPALVVPPSEDAQAQPETALPSLPAPRFHPKEKKTVVVIDDDVQALDLMGRFLRREGLEAVTASTAAEGLRLVREVRPVAITVDLTLPECDGWEVLSELKRDPDLADIPVLLCTLEDETNQAYALGAADFLTKPFDWGRFSQVLRRFRGEKKQARVLIIDDEADNRQLLARTVSRDGWLPLEAENGRVALKCLAEDPPDLILLDLMMPEIDGFELVRLVRKTQAGQSIPIVIVTAKELTGEERDRLSGSVQRVLQKGSCSQDEVLQQVRALIAAAPESGAAPTASQPLGDDGASAEYNLFGPLHQQLEQVRAERDELKARLEDLAASPAEPASGEDEGDHERLREEAELARHRLREQQQSVELLRAECDDAWSQVEEFKEINKEVEKAREERDAVLSRMAEMEKRLAESNERAPLVDWDARHNQLAEQIETLRSELQGPRHEIEEIKAMLVTALAQARPVQEVPENGFAPTPEPEEPSPQQQNRGPGKPQAHQRQAGSPRSPAQESNPASVHAPSKRPELTPRPRKAIEAKPNSWYIFHHDARGKPHVIAATTEEVRTWLGKHWSEVPEDVKVGKQPNGPFEPFSSYAEFRDLLPDAEKQPVETAAPAPKQPQAPSVSRTQELFQWLVPVLVVVASVIGTWAFLVHK